MKLGLCGHKEDPLRRTLRLRDFLVPGFAVPASCDVTFGLVPDDDPLANDVLGVCGLAGPGHFERWEDQLCRRQTVVDGAAVRREYEAFGYVPGDPSTDGGVFALDVFKRWRSVGLFGRTIDAFAQVDFYDRNQTAAATFLLGGVFLCFNLPRSCQGRDVWEVVDDDGGSWGGHMALLQGDTVNSWGQRIRVERSFISRYCFDAYAVVSRAGLRDGRAYSGLDIVAMGRALAAVTG